jgi:NitT/TauT family transport system substrate-binding protein
MQTPDKNPRPGRGGAPLLIAVCFALLLSISIGAVVSHADSPARSPLTVLVPQSTSSLPFLLLAAEQSVPGAELRVQTFLNHAQALALLLRGEADLLYTGTSQGWENRLDGSPIVMITTGIWGVSSLVVRDPSIRGFADLKGKRLALPFPGSPLDFQTRAILDHEGIDPGKDLTISYGGFAQSVPLLLAGKLDAAALPEPLATTVVNTKGLLRVVRYAEAWKAVTGEPESPQVSLFAAEAWAKSHRALLAALLDAWRSASRRVSEATGDVFPRFAPALSTDAATLEESARNTLFFVPEPAANRTRVLSYFQQVARYIPGPSRQLDDGFFFQP